MNSKDIEIVKKHFNDRDYQKISNTDLEQLSIGIKFLAYKFFSGTPFYRAIKYNKKPSDFSQIIYPPIDKCKIGRANLNNEQIFYCARDKSSSLFEVDSKVGDLCVISKWIVESTLIINSIGLTPEVFKEISKGYEIPAIDKLEDGSSAEPIYDESNIVNLEFIGQMFSKENFDGNVEYYELTNRIRHSITNGKLSNYNNRQMDGLLYPTIRNDGKSDCIALFPSVLEKRMISFAQIEFIEILESGEYFDYRLLDAANTITNNEINWLNFRGSYIHNSGLDDLVFQAEGDEINCYTIYNDKLEPESN